MSRSRRASRASHHSPPRTTTPSTPGSTGSALVLTAAQRAAIDGHVRLLLAWTAAINLTAIRDPGEVAVAHVLDSLTAVPLLRSAGIDAFVDLGSGGGLPGLPLAIALPARRALLVESTGKKARFLETAVAAVMPVRPGGGDATPGPARRSPSPRSAPRPSPATRRIAAPGRA